MCSRAPQKEKNTLNLSELIIPIFTYKKTSQGIHEKRASVPGWTGTRHHSNTVKTPRCCEGATPTPSRVQAVEQRLNSGIDLLTTFFKSKNITLAVWRLPQNYFVWTGWYLCVSVRGSLEVISHHHRPQSRSHQRCLRSASQNLIKMYTKGFVISRRLSCVFLLKRSVCDVLVERKIAQALPSLMSKAYESRKPWSSCFRSSTVSLQVCSGLCPSLHWGHGHLAPNQGNCHCRVNLWQEVPVH